MAEFTHSTLYNDANLQEYYKLEDVTGKNGNTLTNTNSVAFSTAKYGNGADGGTSNTNKYLSTTSALGYTGGAYAISCWVKVNTDPGSGVNYWIAQNSDDGSDTDLRIYYQNSGGTRRLVFGRFRVGTAEDAVTYNVDLGTTNFYHLVLTYNGTTLRAYVNNVDVGNAAASGNGASGISDGFRILTERTLAEYASMIVDDVALFDRNLSADDVAAIYNAVEPVSGDAGYSFFM